MAVRNLYIATPEFQELTRERIERESLEEDDRGISCAEHDGLGAFRGFAFAMVIEAALVLLGGVGWELWRMVR